MSRDTFITAEHRCCVDTRYPKFASLKRRRVYTAPRKLRFPKNMLAFLYFPSALMQHYQPSHRFCSGSSGVLQCTELFLYRTQRIARPVRHNSEAEETSAFNSHRRFIILPICISKTVTCFMYAFCKESTA